MNYSSILSKLTSIGPRFAEKELEAAKIIKDHLKSQNIPYITQPFKVEVPVCVKSELYVDGEQIQCMGNSLVSGEIPNGDYLISHFGYSGDTPYNIAYSPITDSISIVDHYKVPSITISRKDIIKIIMAEKVRGIVEVEKRKISTENILVGNNSNPTNIVFAHFDSIVGQGAVDNAGSVAAMMQCLLNNQKTLDSTLYIFSGNEEMAYDDYKPSGYGFRVFENEHSDLLVTSQKIIVMDGLGVGVPSFTQNGLDWVLQVRMLDDIGDKVFWLQNDQTPVLRYFHTTDDVVDILNDEHLRAAENLLSTELLNS